MTAETHNSADELKHIIAEGRISEDALHAMTGVQPAKLRSFLSGTTPGMIGLAAEQPALSQDENARVSILVARLTEGLRIGADERLKAIVESLMLECHLTIRNLSLLTGLDVEDLESVLRDPRTVALNIKYELALMVRTSSTPSIRPEVGELRVGSRCAPAGHRIPQGDLDNLSPLHHCDAYARHHDRHAHPHHC